MTTNVNGAPLELCSDCICQPFNQNSKDVIINLPFYMVHHSLMPQPSPLLSFTPTPLHR